MARILIADRDERIASMLRAAVCRVVDCDVSVAPDAITAAELLATDTFDLVLLDIGMYSDGLETLKQVKDRNAHCEVIALTTGVIHAPLMKTLAAADVAAVVTKPFDVKQLVDLIVKTLRGSSEVEPNQPLIYRKPGAKPTVT